MPTREVMATVSRRRLASTNGGRLISAAIVGAAALMTVQHQFFVSPGISPVSSMPRTVGRASASETPEAEVKDEKIEAFKKKQIVDEAAMLAASDFPVKPAELVEKAIEVLTYGIGVDKPELLSEDFRFVGPVVGPLSKKQFLKALSGFDIESAFPDAKAEYHHFRVDPFEPNRVWITTRGGGTNTGVGSSPLLSKPTGKAYVNPPQAISLKFDKDGLVDQFTVGYVMDRMIGNTGGLGGIYGILYAIGKPLPFPEARPWKKSFQYSMFQKVSGFLSKLSEKRKK